MLRRPRSPDRSSASPEDHALRALARRPLTTEELRSRLESAGHSAPDIERTCAGLAARGWLDDRKLARHYIVSRAARLGHGPDRLIGELVRRGVTRKIAQAAWEAALADGEVALDELLARQIARRWPQPRRTVDGRVYARVYNSLLRAGFPGELVERALAPQRPAGRALDPPLGGEENDDLP